MNFQRHLNYTFAFNSIQIVISGGWAVARSVGCYLSGRSRPIDTRPGAHPPYTQTPKVTCLISNRKIGRTHYFAIYANAAPGGHSLTMWPCKFTPISSLYLCIFTNIAHHKQNILNANENVYTAHILQCQHSHLGQTSSQGIRLL